MIVFLCIAAYLLFGLIAGTCLCYWISKDSFDTEPAVPLGVFTTLGWPIVLPMAGIAWIMYKVHQYALKNRE